VTRINLQAPHSPVTRAFDALERAGLGGQPTAAEDLMALAEVLEAAFQALCVQRAEDLDRGGEIVERRLRRELTPEPHPALPRGQRNTILHARISASGSCRRYD
jgi:hypothetical protein